MTTGWNYTEPGNILGFIFIWVYKTNKCHFSVLGKGKQRKGIKWHSYFWTWMKDHILWQIDRGEFSSCRAYGDLHSSPQWKCAILCAQTITSSLTFWGTSISGGSCNLPPHNPIPQSDRHMISMSQSNSSSGFVIRSGGKELSFLSSH